MIDQAPTAPGWWIETPKLTLIWGRKMEGGGREANQTGLSQLSFGVHSDGPSEIDSEGSQLLQAERDTAVPPATPLRQPLH